MWFIQPKWVKVGENRLVTTSLKCFGDWKGGCVNTYKRANNLLQEGFPIDPCN